MIKKNKQKHDKIVLLAKSKLNSTKFLISNALNNPNFRHDKVVLINNVLKEFDYMNKEIKNLKASL